MLYSHSEHDMAATYTMTVERDPESGWLVAEVAELPGCHTQAPDLMALAANVREAIAVYLETAEGVGTGDRFQGVIAMRWAPRG